jgi:hypothetical protein
MKLVCQKQTHMRVEQTSPELRRVRQCIELYLYRGTRFQGNLCFAFRKQTGAYFSLECSFSSDGHFEFQQP